MFDEPADRRGREQEISDPLRLCSDAVLQIVPDHRRNDTGRAIRRRRHDAPSGSVLLVHRHGVKIEPVGCCVWLTPVGAPLLAHLPIHARRAA